MHPFTMATLTENTTEYIAADSGGQSCYPIPEILKAPVRTPVPPSEVPAIVLAGGPCYGVRPFTATTPKALLRVGQKSLICGVLENLWSAGVRKIFIVVNDFEADVIQKHLKEKFIEPLQATLENKDELSQVELCPMAGRDNKHFGTTDVLRHFKGVIDTDFLVVPCDLVGPVDYRGLIRYHTSRTHLCTMTLIPDSRPETPMKTKKNREAPKIAPGGDRMRSWGYRYRVVASMDLETSRVMGLSDPVSVQDEQNSDPPVRAIRRHPQSTIRTDVIDPHVYMFSKDIFEVLKLEELEETSIRLDLIPYLVKMQDSTALAVWLTLGREAESTHEGDWTMADVLEACNDGRTNVSFYIDRENYAKLARINSIDALFNYNVEMSLDRTKQYKPFANLGPQQKVRDAIISDGCELGENVNIKECVLGRNVIVGNNCKLKKCVIMDNVEIKDNVEMDMSIVGEKSVVSTDVTLKYAIVCPEETVPDGMDVDRDFYPTFLTL